MASAAAAPVLRLAPQSARQARLLRLANTMARSNAPGATGATEPDRLLWAKSHARYERDVRLSAEEETLRQALLPTTAGENKMATHGGASGENLFHFREYPMYPGEYVPPGHDTLASVRDTLRADLTAQSVKNAWMRVSGGRFFSSPQEFYASRDGLSEGQLGDIVNALFPELTPSESATMVRRILETISSPSQSAARSVASTVTADALGLDKSPGHYTNFLEWMSRVTETKAFAAENSIYQFCRRAFNKKDVHTMFHNYQVLSPEAIKRMSADGYSHFFAVLRDYSIKLKGSDTRPQRGVRIDPREIDPATGFSFGLGRFRDRELVCMLRPNREGNGSMSIHGKPVQEYFRDRPRHLEGMLWPFEEAGLNWRNFDVYFYNPMKQGEHPHSAAYDYVKAAQLAFAVAITKQLPLTRIPLKKAGLLTFDRTYNIGDHPGFKGGTSLSKKRPFYKRAKKGIV